MDRFNSIVVRLKGEMACCFVLCNSCFNSIVVRLKVPSRPPSLIIFHRFQFHSGSIKRWKRSPHWRISATCFNSIVVRLKGCSARGKKSQTSCFNSIVVRLKVDLFCRDNFHHRPFQFHSGSIKRIHTPRAASPHSEFQFHSGSIKSMTRSDYERIAGSFNSIVVRLKALPASAGAAEKQSFNSIVVRLKENRSWPPRQHSPVSIP